MATLSVLICCRDDGALLGRAIDAILRQSRRPDELLLLDDGSADDTAGLMGHYVAAHPFIRAFRLEQGQGYVAGLQMLVGEARGDFLQPGCADDYMLDDGVASLLDLADQVPSAAVVMGELGAGPHPPARTRPGVPGWTTGPVDREQVLRALEAWPIGLPFGANAIVRTDVARALGGFQPALETAAVEHLLQHAALSGGLAYCQGPVCVSAPRAGDWTERRENAFPTFVETLAARFDQMAPAVFGDRFPTAWLEARLAAAATNFIDRYMSFQAGSAGAASHG